MKTVVLGLGRMGSRIARKLAPEHEIFVWNRTQIEAEDFVKEHPEAKRLAKIPELKNLPAPRVIWLMLPQGEPTTEVLSEVKKYVESGDIVIDGGNAFYKDTEQRSKEFGEMGVRFLGIGVSGGILASENGYPLMVGGNKTAYIEILPILDTLSKPNGGHEYFGTGGAGHFVKMVHNGIEYGMMQSIGEGMEVLKKSHFNFDLPKTANLWTKGTIVSGFLMDRTRDALEKDPNLDKVLGIIEESGEAKWTVETAKEEDANVEVIEASLSFRRKSKTDEKIQNSFAAKLIAALRKEFGGHSVKEK